MYVLKRTQTIIFSIIFLNVDNSINIENRLLKFSVVIIDVLMEGNVSQIFYSGPSLIMFMWIQKLCLHILEDVSHFLI